MTLGCQSWEPGAGYPLCSLLLSFLPESLGLSTTSARLAPERREEGLASLPLALRKPNSVLFTQIPWSGLGSCVLEASPGGLEAPAAQVRTG